MFNIGEEVVLNYTIALKNPIYYDRDILERLDDITIYVNGVEYVTTKYENYTLSNLKPGNYSVYYKTCNQESNTVNFTVSPITNWQQLRDAVKYASEKKENLTLKLENGNYINTGTITWFNKNMVLTIDGNGQTIDGNQLQVFEILDGSSMLLKNITIKNAVSYNGGAIENDGTLIITQATLTNNTAKRDGGAIRNFGTLTITQSILANNTAKYDGGTLYNYGTLNISESTLANNTAVYGGALINTKTDEYISIVKSNFTSNHAQRGGAILSRGFTNLTDNTFTDNTADNTETIDLNGFWNGRFNTNAYNSTDISLKTMDLRIKNNQTLFKKGEKVVLNYTIALKNPNYYDKDVLKRLDDITVYINGVKNVTTGYENYTLSNLKPGKYEVYIRTCNQESNIVTFSIIEETDTINLTTWDVEMVQGRSVTLSAYIGNLNGTVNYGSVYFEIDGIPLVDENGSILYAPVEDNWADLPYDMPKEISLGNHTLTALYQKITLS